MLRPLTYAEVVKADPFVRKLDNGVVLKIKQWGALETMHIFQGKNTLQPYWQKVGEGKDVTKNSIIIFTFIIQTIYNMTEKPKNFISRFLFRLKYFKWAHDNTAQIMSIWEDLEQAQTCTFFFNRLPFEIANGPVGNIQKDWFAEYCGEYDPKTTAWAFIRQKRELDKAKGIEQYNASKRAQNGNR